jgi:REP element-mobilizing transposase RayT
MARLMRLGIEGDCYHTITVTRGRRPIFADERAADLLLETIRFERDSGRTYVLAYAIMPDHLHLLMVPRDGARVSDVMKDVKGYTAKMLNRKTGRSGAIWQQSFYDRIVRDEEHLATAIDYIHRNPVIAGVVSQPYEYEYSSAHPEAVTDIDAYFEA